MSRILETGFPGTVAHIFQRSRLTSTLPRISAKLAGLALLGLFGLCVPALADSGEGGGSPPETIEVLGSRERGVPQQRATPSRVIGRREIARTTPVVLTDALRGAFGVHLQSTTPGQASPFLRGVTGSAVLNLVDGMRLNHALYRSAPNPYLSLVDPYIADQIEVVRGPAAVLYGSDAMGGLVQVLTRQPRMPGAEWRVEGRLAALFASADLARGMRAELQGGRDGAAVRVGFSGVRTDDLRGGGDTGFQEPTGYDALAGDFAALLELNYGQSVQLDVQWMRQPKTPRYDEMVAGYGQTEPSSDIFYYEPLERLFAHLRYEIEEPPADFLDELRLDVGFQRTRDDRHTRDYGSSHDLRERNTSELFGASAVARSHWGKRLELTWGVDAYLDWVSSHRTDSDSTTGVTSSTDPRYPDGSRMDSYGVFAWGEYELLPELRFQAGLRYSAFVIDLPGTSENSPTTLRPADVSGAVGLLYEPVPAFQAVVNLRRGFRAPNIFDLGAFGPRPGNRYNVPNTNLEPEVLYSADLAFRYFGSRFDFEVLGYYSIYEDRIETVLTADAPIDGRVVVTSANEKRVRIAGFETSGTWWWSERLALRGDVFFSWGEQDGSFGGKQPADRIPPLQGRVGMPWEIDDRFWLEPYLRFAAHQDRLSDRDIQDPRIDSSGTSGWVTLNVRGTWRWSDRLWWALALQNITDESYREHGSGVQSPGVGVVLSMSATFP